MKKPFVSIIIPTYNRKEKLIDSILSIESQNYPKDKFEIIIIDDNSTDDTQKETRKLMKKYKNIRYQKNQRNLGPAASRNAGIRIAKGEYIFFTDDDCVVDKDWLISYINFFEKNKEIGGIGGPLIPIQSNLIARIEKFKDKILKIDMKKPKIGRDEIPVGFTSNVAYKKEVFKEVGYFNEKFKIPAGEDVELKKRVCKKFKIAFLPVIVWHNQEYNLNYLLNILFKQGLDINPQKKQFKKIVILFFSLPFLLFNVIKKILKYWTKNGA